jgi:Tfp pilus assembly protein PilF
MQAGKDPEAIAAFREVVKLDPKFTQAWTHLAALYERGGQEKLALEAFRKAKTQ